MTLKEVTNIGRNGGAIEVRGDPITEHMLSGELYIFSLLRDTLNICSVRRNVIFSFFCKPTLNLWSVWRTLDVISYNFFIYL